MTDLYIVFDTQAEAEAALDAINVVAGFPNPETNTTSASYIMTAGTKFVIYVPEHLPVYWFGGNALLTKAEAEAAGAVF